MPYIRILALFLFVIAHVQGDLYMHNPRFVIYTNKILFTKWDNMFIIIVS